MHRTRSSGIDPGPRVARSAASPPPSESALRGEVRVHDRFTSTFCPGARRLTVWLPPGYSGSARRRYPVLYFHDGQNLFDAARAYAGQVWMLDAAAGQLIARGRIDPLIIVGIDHAGARRLEEFTPTRDPRHAAGGGADHYARMLIEEIKPFVDRHYRTRPEAAHTATGGSSMGGLVSLHLGLRHPRVFTRVAAVSPSVWWHDRAIVKTVTALPRKSSLRIWLDIGTGEGRGAVRDVRALRRALERKGWRRGADLRYAEVPGGEHSERAWAARAARILAFLFPREAPRARGKGQLSRSR
jgi:predicted alpha/beta superfamily hydrolase